MSRPRKFTPEECVELALAWNRGVSLKTLAYQHRADPKTVALAIRNYGEPPEPAVRKTLSQIHVEQHTPR